MPPRKRVQRMEGVLGERVRRAMAEEAGPAVERLAAAFRARQDEDERGVGMRVSGAPFPACTVQGVFEEAFLERVKVGVVTGWARSAKEGVRGE